MAKSKQPKAILDLLSKARAAKKKKAAARKKEAGIHTAASWGQN
jgi:hypothetical protein